MNEFNFPHRSQTRWGNFFFILLIKVIILYLPKNQEVKNCPNRKKEKAKIHAV
jgi:hypothetical protein